MKIGLFLCDKVSPAIQMYHGSYHEMFIKLFPELEFRTYAVTEGEFPKDLSECRAYMTTGSRYSVYDSLDWILKLKEVIADIHRSDRCFVGFCFGHQLIGAALGGKVEKSPQGWSVGVQSFKIWDQAIWMQPLQNPISLLMMCQDQIVALPENCTVLAGNEYCPVGMMQVGHNMLGIQAHPEFSKAYDKVLMEMRIRKIGGEKVRAGIDSLSNTVHRQTIHDWVIKFLHLNLLP